MFEHGHSPTFYSTHMHTLTPTTQPSTLTHSALTPHPTLHQDCMNACMHTRVPTWRWAWQEGGGGRREEEGSCPHLDLHLDLQVGPVDGEQRAVRAGGAQLPGTVGHVPVAVSQEDQRGEGGDLAGEGALVCRGGHRGLHFRGRPHMVDLSPHQRGRGTGKVGALPPHSPCPPPPSTQLQPTHTFSIFQLQHRNLQWG